MNDDMIRAFANTIEAYSELHSKCWGATPEECKKLMTMEFPLIQGMVMQNAIRKVGELPYDSQKAAEQIVAYSKSGEQLKVYSESGAALDRKTVSAFIFEKTGVNKMNENKWFVANDNGDIIGHDMGEAKAKALAAEMQEKEPDAGWEAMNGDGE